VPEDAGQRRHRPCAVTAHGRGAPSVLSVLLHALLLCPSSRAAGGRDARSSRLFPDYPAIALDRVERTPRPAGGGCRTGFALRIPGRLQALWADTLAPPSSRRPLESAGAGAAGGIHRPGARAKRRYWLNRRGEVARCGSWDPRQDVSCRLNVPNGMSRTAAMPRRWSAAAERTDSVPGCGAAGGALRPSGHGYAPDRVCRRASNRLSRPTAAHRWAAGLEIAAASVLTSSLRSRAIWFSRVWRNARCLRCRTCPGAGGRLPHDRFARSYQRS
jgi:hypothetical protein